MVFVACDGLLDQRIGIIGLALNSAVRMNLVAGDPGAEGRGISETILHEEHSF